MNQLPIFLNLRGQACLVVGGGDVAARKVELLREAGANVTVVAPQLCTRLQTLVNEHAIAYHPQPYRVDDLAGHWLIIAATNNEAVNRQIASDAQHRKIFCNVVDRPELCTFTMPSIINRDPVTVAVATGGASPVLARLLRARLETLIPANYGRLAHLLKSFRERVKQRFPDTHQRRRFWEHALQGPIAEWVFNGHERAAQEALEAQLNAPESVTQGGEVYLVGAGPGDPDLLTFRALRLMQQADVVLYDRLVAPEILALCRRDAERIYVGKHRALHAMRQEDINQTLVTLAQQGRRVLRLKGGDPFIFGRGGEEIETLSELGIPFQVVPGITAASGCANYAGIPLTHRDYAQSVVFVTGQLKDGTVDLSWTGLIQPRQTIVVYMGLAALEQICAGLIQHGLHANTPAALIEHGTMPTQRVFTGTVATLTNVIANEDVKAPTLLIVGDVVQLHHKLAWFAPHATTQASAS